MKVKRQSNFWIRTLPALLAVLLLAACSSSPAPRASLPPQPTEPPEEGQTITLITPDAGNLDNTNTKKYQIQTRLTDFYLMNGKEGIAWGITKNALRMYMTRDNGQTWTNISPAATVQFTANPVYGQDIFFADSRHGWIVRTGSGITETIVLHTSDGGQSWKISALNPSSRIAAIYFDSSAHGWLMTTWDNTENRESKALYVTGDGGATWETIMQNEQYTPHSDQPPLPITGVSRGMVFRDRFNGLVSMQFGEEVRLFVTGDGGVSWKAADTLPQPAALKTCSKLMAGSPQFFTETTGWLPVSCEADVGAEVTQHGYFTADGGVSWKYADFSLPGRSDPNRGIPPTFLNTRIGWWLNGDLLYWTGNQGQAWRALPASSVLQAKLKEYPEVVKLQFIDEKTGWLLIQRTEAKRSILLQTINGGVTWKVM
ncbi:hypothetical protein F4V43_06460 [Paenibacillus spiritus]|uniref:Sortilin N-terminal domain-containing protein n=1 Tax=Paenibacillus spiritus TaxID=2496557 RepID=A0A5J5GER5_9BACL|nr:hypothetical protein [Paenibacillus spiritus]KAA9006581.1 hypothetical protein F4V43_06460 [Paenibacillus spiritus]